MNDKVIEIEIALNFLNTLFAKAIYLNDFKVVNEINMLRHSVYYGDSFNYEATLKKLQMIEKELK